MTPLPIPKPLADALAWAGWTEAVGAANSVPHLVRIWDSPAGLATLHVIASTASPCWLTRPLGSGSTGDPEPRTFDEAAEWIAGNADHC